MWKSSSTSVVVVLFLCGALPARAEPEVSPLFSDHMVLQRDQRLPVWGSARPGEEITVRCAGQEKKTTADGTGGWQVTLDPLQASGQPGEMVIIGEKTLAFKDVMVGDVWLCSGQSNMVYGLNDVEEIPNAQYPHLRQFLVTPASSDAPQESLAGSWQACSPQTAKQFTKVGYYFGRDVHTSQNIPIGLINSSVGGTRAQLWLPTSAMFADPVLKADAEKDLLLKLELCKAVRDAAPAAGQWVSDVEVAQAQRQPLPPMPAFTLPRRELYYMGELYNAMIAPLTRFPIKGVVWYQGESNTTNALVARHYRDVLARLIKTWREAWGIGDFPFYIVQLPCFGPPTADHPWPVARESQRLVARQLPNVGQVVLIDLGEANNLHPQNKRDVGARLALLARAKTYGEGIAYSGPEYESMRVVDGEVVLTFAPQTGPLVAKGGDLKHFTIAGADRRFVAATARIEGDTVIVSSDQVTAPVAVRYAWAGNPEGANLFNAAGLPASPFSTESTP